MFRKNSHQQLTFESTEFVLPERAKNKLMKSPEWAFHEAVFKKIDEDNFKELFSNNASRPNAPVNMMVAAIILKEMKKWSYRELFNQIDFNLLTRAAIGLENIADKSFSRSTLFKFIGKLSTFQEEKGIDLFEEVFSEITEKEIQRLGISMEVGRIDSTLIGSNIRKYSRLQLLVEGVRRVWRILSDDDKKKYEELLKPYVEKDSSNYVYGITSDETAGALNKIEQIYVGLKMDLEKKYAENDVFSDVFRRIFDEQIEITSGKIKEKPSSEVGSGSLQSPDDTDATYRKKRDESNTGFLAQITEVVDKEKEIALIVDADVTPNNIDDSTFLEERIEDYMAKGMNEFHGDGAYGSEELDRKLDKHGGTCVQSAVRGRKTKANLTIERSDSGKYMVFCPLQNAEVSKTGQRYRAKFDTKICLDCPNAGSCPANKRKGKHYFKHEDYLKQKRHKSREKIPEERRNIRSGSERTMHEMFHDRRSGKKLKYRGKKRIKLCVVARAIAANFMRIFRWELGKRSSTGLVSYFYAAYMLLKRLTRLLERIFGGNLEDLQNYGSKDFHFLKQSFGSLGF